MKKHITILAIFFLVINVIYSQKKETTKEKPVFKVHKIASKIKIDGEADDKPWKKAASKTLTHFYLTDGQREEQTTTLKTLWDDTNIYFHYQVADKYINASDSKRDGIPYLDDCVELYITPAPSAENIHFSFSINPIKGFSDEIYVENFHENSSISIKSFNIPIIYKVIVDGTVNDNTDIDKGWSVEFSIPKTAFKGAAKKFPFKKGTKWSFQAVRQIRDNEKLGRRVMSTLFPVDNVKQKGTHQSEMFGLLEFVE